MVGTPSPQTISTKQLELAQRAERYPHEALSTLAHFIDLDWLREAYRRTRKDGAPGVDGQVAAEYEAGLEANLSSLLDRFKSGLYRARLREMMARRVSDGVILRVIGKWLQAGVLEGTQLSYPEQGTPQGGVITPLTQKVISSLSGRFRAGASSRWLILDARSITPVSYTHLDVYKRQV